MSIEGSGEGSSVWLTCDDCGETLCFPSFKHAVRFKQKQKTVPGGWRTSRNASGDYADHCPACTKKWAESQQ